MTTEAWMAVIGGVLSLVGFGVHTTYQLGQIKGSLDRDLVHLRDDVSDHEKRLRQIERVQPSLSRT